MTFVTNPEPPKDQCPKATVGVSHHLVPRLIGRHHIQVMTCIFCQKTEKEIRDEHTA